ncbi:MAG: carbohydrate binding domain-containing protein [Bacteroidia bacterium]
MKLLIGSSLFLSLMSCSAQMSESKKNTQVDFNGSFEVFEDGLPVNWLVYTSKTVKTGDFSISSDANEFKLGKQSLRFDIKNCSAAGGRFSPGIAQEIPVKSGETYTVSFWAKNTGSDFVCTIAGINSFARGSTTSLKSNNNSGEWTYYTAQYQIPEKMDQLRIELNILQGGTVWLDGIEIKP